MNVFHLTNKAGDRLSILERGATMQRWSTAVGDSQGGYSRLVYFRVTYQLSEQSDLDVELEASSNATTLLEHTLYPYFNLAPDSP